MGQRTRALICLEKTNLLSVSNELQLVLELFNYQLFERQNVVDLEFIHI